MRVSPAVAGCVAVALLAGAWFALELRQPGGDAALPLDDAWIHLAYARTFAMSGRWALTVGAPATAGTSGYLWTALLSGGVALGLSPVLVSVAAGVVCFAGLVGLWVRLLERRQVPPLFAALSGLGVALCGNLVWLSVSGMEACFTLFLALLAAERLEAGAHRTAGWAAGALALSRPEGLLLGLVLGVACAWSEAGTAAPKLKAAAGPAPSPPSPGGGGVGWRRPGLVVPALGGFLAQLGLNAMLSGAFLPSTLSGRRWLTNQPEAIDWSAGHLARSIGDLAFEWWGRLRDFHFTLQLSGYGGGDPASPQGPASRIDSHLAVLVLLLGALGLAWLLSSRSGCARWLAVFGLLHFGAFAVVLPTPGHGGRYQPVVLFLAAALPMVGAAWLAELPVRRRWDEARARRFRLALLTAVVAVAAGWPGNCRAWAAATASSAAHIQGLHVQAARWTHEHLPPEARIAAFDIGALAFHSGRTVVDISGLTDPAVGHALHRARMLEVVARGRATHLLLTSPEGTPLKANLALYGLYARAGEATPPLRLRTVLHLTTPLARMGHFPMTSNAFAELDLYAIESGPSR